MMNKPELQHTFPVSREEFLEELVALYSSAIGCAKLELIDETSPGAVKAYRHLQHYCDRVNAFVEKQSLAQGYSQELVDLFLGKNRGN